jgi:hypothetical protein
MSQDYLNKREQLFAVRILSKLTADEYYLPTHKDSSCIITIMEEGSMNSLEYLFVFLDNVICREITNLWLCGMMSNHNLGDQLLRLLSKFSAPTTTYLNALVQLILRVVVNVCRHATF